MRAKSGKEWHPRPCFINLNEHLPHWDEKLELSSHQLYSKPHLCLYYVFMRVKENQQTSFRSLLSRGVDKLHESHLCELWLAAAGELADNMITFIAK